MHRILLVTHEFPPFSGGIGRLAHGLATGAAQLGYETHVIAPDFHGGTHEWDRQQPYGLSRFPGGQFRASRDLLRFTIRCRQEIRRLEPDIVHAVDPAGQLALQALSRTRLLGRYFFTVNGSELLVYRHRLAQRLWMSNAFTRVHSVCAISSATRDHLLAMFEISPSKVFVSYPGIDPSWLDLKASDQAAVRSRWDIGPDDFVLVTVARRVPDKGHASVIEGLRRLSLEVRQRTVYVVVGNGPAGYARHLESLARDASVRLINVGFLPDEDVAALYDASDLFAMLSQETPARIEGFGLVYLEAGSRGLPAIARGTGGVPEAVRDGQTGIVLHREAQPEAVAAAVMQLQSDSELRLRLGQQAKRFAGSFTWRRNAAETYGRFSEALDDGC